MTLVQAKPKHFDRLICFKPGEVQLICFAHAGGSGRLYQPWRPLMPPWLGLSAVELPGRGHRRAEPAEVSMARLAEALAAAVEACCAGAPAIFYGHSLGGLVALRTAQAWRRLRDREPALLAVGGVAPPGPAGARRRRPPHDDVAVLLRLRALGGMPADALDDPQLMQILLPALRADFALLGDDASCEATDHAALTCPILALHGDGDGQCDRAGALAWQVETRGDAAAERVGVGHFFHQTAAAETVAHIVRRAQMQPAVAAARSPGGCVAC